MSKTLKINGTTILPVHNIRTIKPINDEERARMAAKYGKPADDFAGKNISIQFADKTSKTAELMIDDVRGQGIALVNAGAARVLLLLVLLLLILILALALRRTPCGAKWSMSISTTRTARSSTF